MLVTITAASDANTPSKILLIMFMDSLFKWRLPGGNSALSTRQGHHHQCRISRCNLERVLKELLRRPGDSAIDMFNSEKKIEGLAMRWFTDPKAKKKVSELLGKYRTR